MNPLETISPIDGRYAKQTESLGPYFSEAALIRYRTLVECEYLIALVENKSLKLKQLSSKEKQTIRDLYIKMTIESALKVKEYEATTNHDVKSVEYFIKEKLKGEKMGAYLEWVHFALTSEDVNNLSYALLMQESMRDVIIPELKKVQTEFDGFAKRYAKLPMLARTHGQAASPTTLGKEFKVFAFRLERQIEMLESHSMLTKMSGATGNFHAHIASFPSVDWQKFSKDFVKGLSVLRKTKLAINPLTTQIESHDTVAELFDILKRANIILSSANQDIWRYISDSWIVSKPKAGEVGSSTMPHKVNPIDFENSEGNLGIANALLNHFSSKLPISRLQRDLTDSTVFRNVGVAFAHSLLAYKSLLKGFGKISVNEGRIKEDLNAHPEVVAEAIQTVLRVEGVAMPYEKLKELTRGKKVTMEDISVFIDGLEVGEELKKRLKKITPESYIGLAAKLAGK
ncbi:MAG: adenylosuccinate lyase [Candidatus Paceibacterota bacterium]|jgi:adenylosuccinate lyase